MISVMGDLLLRNVPLKTLDALKARARSHSRSVQVEALELLERGVESAAGPSLLAWAKTIRDSSVELEHAKRFVREMRDER